MLKVLELFAGIGACSKALERLGIEHEIVDAVEIDKYAIESFNAIHNTNFEPQDITKWNKDIEVDLIMHGSPCQDFSVAGKGAGGDEGTGTRSSLMYETIRIVEKLKPQYVIWENVKNVLSKKHKHNFDNYINRLKELGYNSYYQVLNSKDYGIPQNRERVFTISIRKDINKGYIFPSKQELKLRLKDMLENKVDEKYYLSDKMIKGFEEHNTKHSEKGTGFIWKPKNENDIASTLRSNSALCPTDNTINVGEVTKNSQAGQVYSDKGVSPTIIAGTHGYAIGNIIQSSPKCVQVGNLQGGKWDKINESCKRVYDEKGISPTIHTCQGGNTEPKVLEEDIINPLKGISGKSWQFEQNVYASESKCLISIKAGGGSGNIPKIIKNNYRIRKLTPLECWRLQGFDDEDFYKAKERLNNTFYRGRDRSNSQLYKQAGNSITVNVLEKIFLNLF